MLRVALGDLAQIDHHHPPGRRQRHTFRNRFQFAGLADLAGFSHIFILYHFHLSKKFSLTVKPFLDDQKRGLFATRAPSRPNPIGLSVVRLLDITESSLEIQDVDVVDGTPLLDIKPYVPDFDMRQVDKFGWIGEKTGKVEGVMDDGRFSS